MQWIYWQEDYVWLCQYYNIYFFCRCSTAVESLPSMPPYSSQHHMQPDLQKMRILIGSPLKKPPKHSGFDDSLPSVLSSPVTDLVNVNAEQKTGYFSEERRANCEGFDAFVVYCTSDFVTVSKEVYVRARRVRLLGFEVCFHFSSNHPVPWKEYNYFIVLLVTGCWKNFSVKCTD